MGRLVRCLSDFDAMQSRRRDEPRDPEDNPARNGACATKLARSVHRADRIRSLAVAVLFCWSPTLPARLRVNELGMPLGPNTKLQIPGMSKAKTDGQKFVVEFSLWIIVVDQLPEFRQLFIERFEA